MPHAKFVHLRVHTAYSLSEGAIHIKALAELASKARMPAVAITDTDNMFGALEFSEAMTGAGVQPVIGTLLALEREGEERRGGARRAAPERLVLLAQDDAGYRNMGGLSSLSHMRTAGHGTPEVKLADLAGRTDGLIALTGGADGPVGRLLADGQRDAAVSLVRKLALLFPGRLYVELQRHGTPEERRVEPMLVEIAYAEDLPLVATNDVFFATPDMHAAHDALLCIDQGVVLEETERRRVTAEHHFKSAEAMRELFADLPEAVDNTLVIAQRCAVRSPKRKPILPRFGDDEPTLLRQMSEDGLAARLDALALPEAARAPYRERLAHELDVIIGMGFPGYFLIVADFIQWAKRQSIPVGPGRGSGAGSVVAWSLKITDLDPLRFNLLFERFLNPERVSMPDFDIDFCQDRRDEVIQYVRDKYGESQVAQIITFGKLQARAVLRDVGRVLGMAFGQVDRLCKLVPNNPAKPVTLQQAIDGEPRLQQARREDEQIARLFDIALRLEGLYRHASTHAAGVVIGDRPLDELVPLYRDPRSDMLVTQFNMKWVESAGLVKFDFLGLKTLTVLEKAVDLVRRRGVPIDLDRLPFDDRAVYELIGSGDTAGIFQLESSGMRDMLRRMRPDTIEDIIAIVALYRPGPMDNIPKFISVKHGEEKPDYLHERLKPILEETYGVIVYQEQVMQIAQVLSGYSLGQADLLRRAMGKKVQAEMDAQEKLFRDGATERGVDGEQAAYIFNLVAKFAGYGFNKSHAAAYALVAYQTAYLKANHPVEFMAALMTLDMSNTDKLGMFRQELGRLRVELLGPDINRSEVEFAVETQAGKPAIRYALAAIRNVGREAMRQLVAERQANGPFRDLWDFAQRLDPRLVNKRTLENLGRAGAFDPLDANRARVGKAIDLLLRAAQQAAEDRQSRQVTLFGDGGLDAAAPPLPDVPELPAMERLAQEADAVGFYLSGHPLDAYRNGLNRQRVQSYTEFRQRALRGDEAGRLAGTVLSKRESSGQKGRFAFLMLSDASSVYEVVVFSELLAAKRDLLEAGRSLVMNVKARVDADQVRLNALDIEDIDEAIGRTASGLEIFLGDPGPLESISTILSQRARGRGRVALRISLPEHGCEVEMNLPGQFQITPQVRGAIKAVPGVLDVHDL